MIDEILFTDVSRPTGSSRYREYCSRPLFTCCITPRLVSHKGFTNKS